MIRANRASLIISALALLVLSTASGAQSLAGFSKLALPGAPKVVQRLQGPAPAGWKAMSDPQLTPSLDSVRVFDGHPSELAALVPDNEPTIKNDKSGAYDVWTVDGTQRPIWVVASYTSTSLTMGYELPRQTKEVRVYYNRSDRTIKAVFYR